MKRGLGLVEEGVSGEKPRGDEVPWRSETPRDLQAWAFAAGRKVSLNDGAEILIFASCLPSFPKFDHVHASENVTMYHTNVLLLVVIRHVACGVTWRLRTGP